MNDDTYQEVYQDEPVTVENLGGICMNKEWETGCTVNRETKMDCICAKEDGKVACRDESTQRYIDSLKKAIEEKDDEIRKLSMELDRINRVKDEEIERLKSVNESLRGLLGNAYSMFGELFELAKSNG